MDGIDGLTMVIENAASHYGQARQKDVQFYELLEPLPNRPASCRISSCRSALVELWRALQVGSNGNKSSCSRNS